MSATTTQQALALLVLSPGPQHGDLLPPPAGTSVVGRAPGSDVRLDDPTVSRRHAKVVRTDDAVVVVDLGSSGGTRIAGRPVADAAVLAPGQEVAFAAATMRLVRLDAPAGPPGPPAPRASYEVRQQHAGVISNVGNDQYVSYVQHVVEQRESFLSHVAATKTWARWLVWGGLATALIGFALFAQYVLGFVAAVFELASSGDPYAEPELPESSIAGVPTFVIGFVLNAVGSAFLVIGVVLHVVASARARRVDRDLPLPPPVHP